MHTDPCRSTNASFRSSAKAVLRDPFEAPLAAFPFQRKLRLIVLLAVALGASACSSAGGDQSPSTAGTVAGMGGIAGAGMGGAAGSAGRFGASHGLDGGGGSLAGSTTTGGESGSGHGGSGLGTNLGGAGGLSGGAGSGGVATSAGGMGGSGGSEPDAGVGGDAVGGMGAFEPCPADGNPCRILPLGDSITYGDKSSDKAGYRSQLYKLILAADQKVAFTGSRSDGPSQVSGQPFPRMHEGHPGWTIDPGYNTNPAFDGGISQLIPSPALNGDPHIILLCIGTNDLFARDTEHMATRLDALLDLLVANAPNALIVLAQITPLADANAALTAYNAEIPQMVGTRAAAGQHIIGVDMSTLPKSGLNSDGTHPNDSGYAYMAGIWYAAIKDLLPK